MLTIEEAWEALDAACGQRMKLDKPAARAALMAVLEGAFTHQHTHTYECLTDDQLWCPRTGLRAQIAALGQDGVRTEPKGE